MCCFTSRVEEWRGGLGLPICFWLFRLPVPQYQTMLRFHSPLSEPDRRISRIRLSDQTRVPYAHREMRFTTSISFTKPYFSYSFISG